jgi:hypothetical protein
MCARDKQRVLLRLDRGVSILCPSSQEISAKTQAVALAPFQDGCLNLQLRSVRHHSTHAKARRLHFTKLRSTHPQHVIYGLFKAASAVARPLPRIDTTKCRRPPHLATSITSRPGRSHDRGHPDLVLLLARQVRREHLCSIAASRVNSPVLELSIGNPKKS